MRDAVYQQLDRIATWPIFAVLVVSFILCYLGFQRRKKVINELAGGKDVVLFDGRASYTPDEARDLLETMGERGRRIYAITQVTLDFIFPFVYGGLFLIALFRLYGGDPGYLLLVPLIAVVADWLENFTATYLALSYKGVASPAARFASAFTVMKRSAITVSILLMLAGVAIWVWRWRRASG
jgi:hypothetical protein